MDHAFEGAAALITGGAAGIGRATALELARRGVRIALVDKSEEAARGTAQDIEALGGKALVIQADASDEAQVADSMAQVESAFGGLHFALNNIGGGETGKTIVTTTLESWNDIIARNLTAAWLAMKHQIPVMERSGGGAIVNTASMAGVSPMNDASPAYAAAKAGVMHLTRYGARAHAAQRIRINAVAPGLTRTALVKQHLSDDDVERIVADSQFIKRACEPEEIAAAIVYLMSPEAAMVTGTTLPVTGGVP